MRFSWIVLLLGSLAPLVVLSSEWTTGAADGELPGASRPLSWYSPLPLVAWLGLIAAVLLVDRTG